MREAFREKRWGATALDRIAGINAIIAEYQAQDIQLTLRQLYYQLVARGLIPNIEREYKNLSNLVSEGRYCGLIDWDAIEDRARQSMMAPEYDDLPHFIRSVRQRFRLRRWATQDYYVELWCEKDAISSVLWPIAYARHARLMVNRGYSSSSAMYASAQRFIEQTGNGKACILLYLGDHDPSGLDMTRDIGARLAEFGAEVEVVHVALTTEQVQQYSPPPNPAKVTDPRAGAYIAEFGRTSWEVDALPPNIMTQLVQAAIDRYVDQQAMDEVIAAEQPLLARIDELMEE